MSDHRCAIPGCVDPSDQTRRPKLTDQTDGHCCTLHYHRLRRSLLDLPQVVAWLRQNLAAGRGHQDHVSGTPDTPVPIRLAVVDHINHIDGVLVSWTRLALEEHPQRSHGPQVATTTTCAQWLADQLPWIDTTPWVDELYREVAEIRRDAHRLVPWQRSITRLTVPCWRCNVAALAIYGGDDAVTCRHCRSTTPREQYDFWARYLLHEAAASS